MKVGIYIASISSDAGGGYTYQDTIIRELGSMRSKHEIYIFHYGSRPITGQNERLHFVQLEPYSIFSLYSVWWIVKNIYFLFFKLHAPERINPLARAVSHLGIDFVIFPTMAYEFIDVPFAITVWDLQHRLQPFFPEVSKEGWTWSVREKYYQRVLPLAAYIITGTKEGKDEIKQFYGVHESRFYQFGHPTPAYVLDESIHEDKSILKQISSPYLFYPAQFWPHKNHIVLLKALKILQKTYHVNNLSLVFTGSDKGNLQYIKNIIHEYHLGQHVHILGFVTQNQMKSLYKNAQALVYPTLFGPENLPPLEAMALGCPCIVSDVPGAREQYGNSVQYVDSTDETKWAKVMSDMMNGKNRLILMSRGRKRALAWTGRDFVCGLIRMIEAFEKYKRTWK